MSSMYVMKKNLLARNKEGEERVGGGSLPPQSYMLCSKGAFLGFLNVGKGTRTGKRPGLTFVRRREDRRTDMSWNKTSRNFLA